MAAVNKIDSTATSLRIAEEQSIGVLPGTPEWIAYEPNSYDNFGGEISTVARNPINESRQRQKGVITDLDAAAGFESDLTQSNLQDILQGFFFADLRPKGEELVTAVTGTTDLFDVASTTGFQVNDIIEASGFLDPANNGIHIVTAIVSDTTVEVLGSTLVTEAAPPAAAQIIVVGHRAGAGDVDVDASGILPVLTSTTLDFTTLGLVPGETIFIGGDLAALAFSNSVNNGFMRVKAIAANQLDIDKAQGTMVTEASTTETIEFYFGRVLKNENTSSLITRRTYQLERSLGAPDDSLPAQIQGEYIVGGVPNELSFNFATADKVLVNLGFVGTDNEQVTGAVGLKTGNRPTLVKEDAFNTSSDFSRLKMSVLDGTDENPTALFAFLTEFSLSINNNVSPNKAIGTLGAFDATAGQFNVDGSVTAYFADVAGLDAVRNNSDVSLDFVVVKSNAGIAFDVPLIALGDGRLNVEQDAPITIPLNIPAAADRDFDHTLLMVFFDYLPDAADTV